MKTILLGQKVKDIVSGLEGIVIIKAEYLHGSTRITVQPPLHENKVPEAQYFDEPQLQVIDAKKVIDCKITQPIVELGINVKDPISSLEGVAIGRSVHLNGCARILIAPTELDNDGKYMPGTWIDEPQVEVRKNKTVMPSSSGTGGPAPSRPSRAY